MQDRAQGGAFDDSMSSLQLEIYRKGGHKQIVQPGAPILEWHFWKDGDQVAVFFGGAAREHMLFTILRPVV